ncbi:uncharacterized protein LOC117205517 isoform X2 [Bombus bifarius]|uniref:Uncharacterized protein LOC117205517 isoform X2 n=1 Tax=Bombus bifarius TaxID=103933 RepID=A0A6P8LHY5_9HYME|nr:uncharacterized protein LOC117155332 isoform X2 [Bombus vancouverensis nearcticus]XP_033299886.1 uncharacterized protein LOC117205517 isoform X2 [Bombus bifarius]
MERRDRFILLRSTCTVKMQSRLARQRIHQHTRAHETAVPSLPWDLDVEAEGVVYPALPLRYQLAPILSTKDSTFLIDKDGRDISTRRICRNDAEAKKNATSVGVRIKREKRKQEEAGKVTGLKLLYISVPPYSFRGQSALLECRYDLEADKLYSITWYKDHEEFYRYVPRGEPTKHSYRVEGVKVDHRKSNDKEVLLQDVSLHSSGRYKCEVSAEAPSFNSVSAEASMEVAVLPQDGPSITGEEKVYATGDVLGLNCTSGKSHPAATLKWFINREQGNESQRRIIRETEARRDCSKERNREEERKTRDDGRKKEIRATRLTAN